MHCLFSTHNMKIVIPDPSLVILIGPSGSGKSTFARRHFLKTQIVSSDLCRALISDDENNQEVSKDAFDLLYFIARKRLYNNRLAVVDATNVLRESRKRLFLIANAYKVPTVGIVFNLPKDICLSHNRRRRGRLVEAEVVDRQCEHMKRAMENLPNEEFTRMYILDSQEKIREAEVETMKGKDKML
jgi:protein phosphatase